MTIDEFNKTGWIPRMKAMYRGKVYPIIACDFEEQLVGLDGVCQDSSDISWVRCENIQIV